MRSRKWRKLIRQHRTRRARRPSSIKRRPRTARATAASDKFLDGVRARAAAWHSLIKKRIQFWLTPKDWRLRAARDALCHLLSLCHQRRWIRYRRLSGWDAGRLKRPVVDDDDDCNNSGRIVHPPTVGVINAHWERRPCPWDCLMSSWHLLSRLWCAEHTPM